MSYETDFLNAAFENMKGISQTRREQQETVATIASSMFVQRLMQIYEESQSSNFEKWLNENYEQRIVAPFRDSDKEGTDSFLQFLYEMAKEWSDSREMLTVMAQKVNRDLRGRGFRRGFNEANFYFIENI